VVYDTPASQFVGGFIGTPPMNFLVGHVQPRDGRLRVRIGDFELNPAPGTEALLEPSAGQTVLLGIRAESMETSATPVEGGLAVEVLVVEPLGSQNLLTVNIGETVVKVATHPDFAVESGTQVWLRFPAEKIRWMDRETGRALV